MAQDMLSKVRALIDSADSYDEQAAKADTPQRTVELQGAAANYRAKAEELMRKYRIDQEQAIARETISIEPVKIDIVVCDERSPYRQQYINMLFYCAMHTEVRVKFDYQRQETGWVVVARVVGYEMDVELTDMLYTSARLVFSERLEPKVDKSLSDQVNAYRLRAAGIERVRASAMLWGRRDPGRIGRLYLAECKVRGEAPALTGRGVTGATYREQYADTFVTTLRDRLYWARNAADSTGGTMSLHGRKARVDEAFYTLYPGMRPAEGVVSNDVVEPCKLCTDGKLCRAHQAAQNAWERQVEARLRKANSTAGRAGRMSGRDAAAHVELGRTDAARRLNTSNGTTSREEIGS